MKTGKERLLKAVEFLLGFACIYIILSSAVLLSVPMQVIESVHAGLANGILAGLGSKGKIIEGNPVLIEFNGLTVEINELCTGLVEFLVLMALMLASFEVSLRKRLYGVAFALVVWLVVNPLRIALTVMQLLNAPIELAVLSHDVLFRVSLFVVIVLAYFYWLKWAEKEKS